MRRSPFLLFRLKSIRAFPVRAGHPARAQARLLARTAGIAVLAFYVFISVGACALIDPSVREYPLPGMDSRPASAANPGAETGTAAAGETGGQPRGDAAGPVKQTGGSAAVSGTAPAAQPQTRPTASDQARQAAQTPKDPIRELVGSLTLREKIAQHFILWIPRDATAEAIEGLRQLRPAGYIVYPWNYSSLDNLRQLTATLSSPYGAADRGIRPFISADQEGGRVAAFRFKEFPVQPSAYLLGTLKDPALVEASAHSTALALRYLGVNMNLAPVADVYPRGDGSIIGDRSYGPEPAAVAESVAAAVRGLQKGLVIPSIKHFPGHGATSVDSHADLPKVQKSLNELRTQDLVPFSAGIAAGAPVVMTAHILYQAIDPVNPATLSPFILQNILRKELGFDGVILTDGFEMGALSKNFTKAEALLRALNAGINLILLYNRYDPTELFDLMEGLVREGKFPMEKVDENLERILKVKAQYGLLKTK